MFDKDKNAILGDFRLSQAASHGRVAWHNWSNRDWEAYITPQLDRIWQPSLMLSFEILVLEMICGKRPIVADKTPVTCGYCS